MSSRCPGRWCRARPGASRSADAKFRAKYGVTVVAINPQKDSYTFALPETVVNEGDILVVAGTIDALDRFGQLD